MRKRERKSLIALIFNLYERALRHSFDELKINDQQPDVRSRG